MSKVTISPKNEAPVVTVDTKEKGVRKCHVPTFRYTQVNRGMDEVGKWNGEILSEKEVWIANVSACLDASWGVFGEDDGTMLCIVMRQKKVGSDDPVIAIMTTGVTEDEDLEIKIGSTNQSPTIDINTKISIATAPEKKKP